MKYYVQKTNIIPASTIVSRFLESHKVWFTEEHNDYFGQRALITEFLSAWSLTGRFPQTLNYLETHAQNVFEEWLNSSWIETE